MLAVTPSTRHAVIDSPIGPLTIVRDDEGITGLYYPGHWTNPDPAIFGPRVDVADDQRRWCCSSAQQLAGAEIGIGLGEAAEHSAHDLDRIHLVGRNCPHAEPPRRALPIGGPHLLAVRHG